MGMEKKTAFSTALSSWKLHPSTPSKGIDLLTQN